MIYDNWPRFSRIHAQLGFENIVLDNQYAISFVGFATHK